MARLKQLLRGYERFLDILEKIISCVLFICVLLMVTVVVIGVVFRNVHFSATWINELSQYACIYAIYLGLGLAIKYKMLAGVDIVSTITKGKADKILYLFQNTLIILFLVAFLLTSYPLLDLLYTTGRLSPEMRVPIIYGYMGPVIGVSFALLFAIDVFIRDLIGREVE